MSRGDCELVRGLRSMVRSKNQTTSEPSTIIIPFRILFNYSPICVILIKNYRRSLKKKKKKPFFSIISSEIFKNLTRLSKDDRDFRKIGKTKLNLSYKVDEIFLIFLIYEHYL